MKKLLIILFFFVFFVNVVFADIQEDCFDELVLKENFEGFNYSDFRDSLDSSSYYEWLMPFESLDFTDEIVSVKLYLYGDFVTNFNVGDWPDSREYMIFEMYNSNPMNMERDYSGCGFIKINPLGSYNLNYNQISNANYQSNLLMTYNYDVSQNANFYKYYFDVDSIDTNDNNFVNWEVFRVFVKDDNLFFPQYGIIPLYNDAIDDYQLNNNQAAISNYQSNISLSGEDWAEYLRYKDFYEENQAAIVNIIDNDITPSLYFPPEQEIVTYKSPLGDDITTNGINDLISKVNSNSNELQSYGFSHGNQVSLIFVGDVILSSTFLNLVGAVNTNLNSISRSSSLNPSNYQPGDIITKSDFDLIVDNYNFFMNNKACVNVDFFCNTWSQCDGSFTTRSVTRNRNCIGNLPVNKASCSWKLYVQGSIYYEGDCSGSVYRDDVYRDVFGTQVSGYCGVYNFGQWIGNAKTIKTYIGTYDNCGNSN